MYANMWTVDCTQKFSLITSTTDTEFSTHKSINLNQYMFKVDDTKANTEAKYRLDEASL